MALRTIACLPALTGAWRDPAGGVLLSTSGNYPVATGRARTAGPDANAAAANDQHEHHRPRPAARATADPGALRLQQQPAGGRPAVGEVVRGFARDDLFTVVHDLFQTDTADYADILLPATSHMEQLDIHKSYGHLYCRSTSRRSPRSARRCRTPSCFAAWHRGWVSAKPCFADSDDDLCRQAFDWSDPRLAGLSWEKLKADGHARLNLPRGARRSPTAASRRLRANASSTANARRPGLDPLPDLHRTARMAAKPAGTGLPAGADHAAGTQLPQHQLCQLGTLPGAGKIARSPHQSRPTPRHAALPTAARCASSTSAANFAARAVVTDRARPGVAMATSIWWRKLSPDGRNCNEVTSQALTDMGGGATFYDCLVELSKTASVGYQAWLICR
jgi:hypothetical protein